MSCTKKVVPDFFSKSDEKSFTGQKKYYLQKLFLYVSNKINLSINFTSLSMLLLLLFTTGLLSPPLLIADRGERQSRNPSARPWHSRRSLASWVEDAGLGGQEGESMEGGGGSRMLKKGRVWSVTSVTLQLTSLLKDKTRGMPECSSILISFLYRSITFNISRVFV